MVLERQGDQELSGSIDGIYGRPYFYRGIPSKRSYSTHANDELKLEDKSKGYVHEDAVKT